MVRSLRRVRAVLFAVPMAIIVTIGAAGCTGSDQAEPTPGPVTIGLLSPTGDGSTPAVAPGSAGDDAASPIAASVGLDATRGAQLAVDVVNGAYPDLPVRFAGGNGLPGLAGRKLALTSGIATSADDAANATSSLIAHRAVAIVVADSADVAAAAGSQAQRSRVPLVDGFSTADYLTELGLDWYFRTVPSDRLLAETAFALLHRQLAARTATAPPRVAILTESGTPDAAASAGVRDLAQRAGYTVSSDVTVQPRQTESNTSQQAESVGSGRADAILALVHTGAAAAVVTRLAARLDPVVPLVGLGAGFAQLPASAAPAAVVLRTTSWSAELTRRNPAGTATSELYQSRYGTPMTDTAANVFTAVLTVAAAIDAARSDDPATIRAALRQGWQPATALIMPWNGIRFDSTGQNQLAAGVVEGRTPDGYRVVFPPELSSGSMIWAGPAR